MQATPWFLGACALASFTGAVSGATINTHPIQQASIGSDEIVRPAIAFNPTDTGRGAVALPDHYAMETPEGIVPVAALSTRGIYSQRRYGFDDVAYSPPSPPAYFPPVSNAENKAEDPAPDDRVASLPDPSGTPAEPSVSIGAGQPRIIDVSAVLASRE